MNRICLFCGTTESKGWYLNHDGTENSLCRRCFDRHIRDPSPERQKAHREYWHKHPEKQKMSNERRITFKNKTVKISNALRTGVCNLCRAVAPFDTKITHMHHEKYDGENPAAYTIEVCTRCHRGITVSPQRRNIGYKMLNEYAYCRICKKENQLCRVGILQWFHKRCSYCLLKLG